MDLERVKSCERIAIIIDGTTLAFLLQDTNLRRAFFKLGLSACSVICCRVSPKQKADVRKISNSLKVVSTAKSLGQWITLSIGDGANDVSMILEAHIGVGIRGKEGTQAVRSADYAISQFRFIQTLLLVHGRWGYQRVSLMICYYFYKNIVLVFTEIYFAFYNGFSG
jgi:P-type E1-E2 ATPase